MTSMQILLLEKGYEDININEITELADTALGTFYNYFDSKASILTAVMELLVKNYHLDVDYIIQSLDDPAEKVAASIGYTLSKVIDGSGLGKLIFASGIPVDVYTAVFRDRGLADMKEGIESNRFSNSDPDIAISMVIGGGLYVASDLYNKKLPKSACSKVVEHALTIMGLNAEEARRVVAKKYPLVKKRPLPISLIETQERCKAAGQEY